MKKRLVFAVFVLVILGGFLYLRKNNKSPESQAPFLNRQNDQEITATFEIYTLGTKRVFNDSKYHNRSEDVYITAENPSIVYVQKIGITWQDFFETLPAPMKINKECLTTGTGQQFCSGPQGSLTFTLNDRENPDALDDEIEPADRLIIRYE